MAHGKCRHTYFSFLQERKKLFFHQRNIANFLFAVGQCVPSGRMTFPRKTSLRVKKISTKCLCVWPLGWCKLVMVRFVWRICWKMSWAEAFIPTRLLQFRDSSMDIFFYRCWRVVSPHAEIWTNIFLRKTWARFLWQGNCLLFRIIAK